MPKLNINEQLHTLYKSKWPVLCAAMEPILSDELQGLKPTCPLLLSVEDEDDYGSAEIRIMVYGQETNDWYGIFRDDLDYVVSRYDEFFNERHCWRYGGHFWNGVARFRNKVQAKFPDKKVRILWNNVIKIGKHNLKGRPPQYIVEIEKKHLSIMSEELEIVRPNIALFFTGPSYDDILLGNFHSFSTTAIEPYKEKELSTFQIPGVDFSFRTYHPNYLWRNNIDNYFDAIIAQIEV